MFWRKSLGNCWCGSLAAKIQTNNIWIILLIIEKGGRTYDLKVQFFSFKPYIPKNRSWKKVPKKSLSFYDLLKEIEKGTIGLGFAQRKTRCAQRIHTWVGDDSPFLGLCDTRHTYQWRFVCCNLSWLGG